MKKNNTSIWQKIKASTAILALSITTITCFIPIFFIGLLKLIPIEPWQAFCTRLVDSIAVGWCEFNNTYIHYSHPASINITGLEEITRKNWHLVIANHQSWLDIVILQFTLNRKLPILKFFIKDQLKWVPLLGFAWWAMGCPFMKRYSKSYLEKYPHKKGKDTKATIKAINTFKQTPASIMNFVEGTRYTKQKASHQHSPYQHLLKPKAGGIGFVIGAMSEQIKTLLDVTIVYGGPEKSLWDFLCHKIHTIKVHVREVAIPTQFLTLDLLTSERLQLEVREWLNQVWAGKDAIIQTLETSMQPQ